jgi:Bacterial PH domain
MRYPTKVDGWIRWIILGALGLELVAGAALVSAMGWAGAGLAVLSIGTFLGIIRMAAWPVVYDVTDGEIRVSCGAWGFRVPISGIVRVYPTRNPMSAPAWSLDRLRIDYVDPSGRKRMTMISPPDQTAFLLDLAARDPALVRQGDRLVRG